jgi:outer membrane protein OmpA-like peptidoglycan-associated protein
MILMNTQPSLLPILVLTVPLLATADNCQLSESLVFRANELHNQNAPRDEQIQILTQAVTACATNINAHNNLANVLGDEQRYAEAVAHYREALQLNPTFTLAWYGLGDTYRAWGRLPQSLEAFLHACTQDADAKRAVMELIKDGNFAAVEDGKVLDSESLTLLFDPKRRQEIDSMIATCGLRAVMETHVVLRNLEFNSGKATLAATNLNQRQMAAIGQALQNLTTANAIHINGHSDNQPFAGVSRQESARRNLLLSQQRADTIRQTLIEEYALPAEQLIATGFGEEKPVSKDRARNRRVEIEVK